MRLSEGRTPLYRLPVPRVRQHPFSVIRDTRTDIGREGGGESESGAARRPTPLSREAALKTLRRANMETTKTTEEKEDDTGDGWGTAGDLLGYISTG